MNAKGESVRVVFIRHADAGSRERFKGPDFLRPLSPKGIRQAGEIAERFDVTLCRSIASSPAVRCVETVAPIAALSGREVSEVDVLAEGSDAIEAFDWLIARAIDLSPSEVTIGSTHGDVMIGILEVLANRGFDVDGAVRDIPKAGSIEVELVRNEIVSSRFVSPP